MTTWPDVAMAAINLIKHIAEFIGGCVVLFLVALMLGEPSKKKK